MQLQQSVVCSMLSTVSSSFPAVLHLGCQQGLLQVEGTQMAGPRHTDVTH